MPMGGNYRPLGGGYLGNPNRPFQQPTITNEWGYRGANPFARGFVNDPLNWQHYGIQSGMQGNYANPYLYYLGNPQATYNNYNAQGFLGNTLRQWFPTFTWQPRNTNPLPVPGGDAGWRPQGGIGDTPYAPPTGKPKGFFDGQGGMGNETITPSVVPPVVPPVNTEPEPYKPWLPPRQEQPDPIVPPIVPPSNGVVTPYRPPNRPPIRRGW